MIEDDTFIIKGLPPLEPIPNISIGKHIYDKLRAIINKNEALIDALTGESISYEELLVQTCSLAESLRKSGYNENTIITISSENCLEFFIPIIAALYIGATIAPINHNYTKHELVHTLNIAKPSIVFCSKEVISKFLDVKKNLNFIKKIVVINSKTNVNGEECLENFIGRCLNKTPLLNRFQVVDVNVDDHMAFILYSSGTTGLPKGVMITHKNVMVKFLLSEDHRFIRRRESGCVLGLLPFFHAYGLFTTLNAIYKEIKVVVIKRFEEHLYLSCIEKYKIQTLLLVPSLAVLLAKSPLVKKYDLSSVTDVGCGAAPLSKETSELIKKRLKVKSFQQGYGLTECTLGVTGMPLDQERHGSSGKIVPYMLCKVRDPETGKSLGPNQVGELCFKGPLVMKGYYGNEEATKNTFTSDGWLLTGDLGYYDEEEYFFISGRLKELIKYKGFQVPPAELEAVLLTNPKIKDAAVIGLPNEEVGELPLAFIVKNSNSSLTEEEVKQYVADKVSPYKRLRGGVRFIQEIPKNPSGKILRGKLKELLNLNHKSKL